MAYGLIYTCDFDNFNGYPYLLEFHKKDYSGAVTAVTGGASPVVHSWGQDDIFEPVKGSSIDITLINEAGNFPLSNFYSNEDDTFLVKLYSGVALIFIGYLVQDDCNEVQNEFTHELKLSATDNLGLLKDVPLGNKTVDNYAVTITYSSNNTFNIISGTASVKTGDTIIITNSSIDGSYTVLNADYPTTISVQVTPDISLFVGSDSVNINVTRVEDLKGRYTLAKVFKYCLQPTNLLLNTRVYSEILPLGYTVGRWIEDTIIDINTFQTNDGFQDCYKILEDVLKRFRASLFQAQGVWNIVRWDELKNSPTRPGHEYDSDMVWLQDVFLTDNYTIGNGEDIETGLTASIIRPFKAVKETFNYRQPENLLRNSDWSTLGAFITSYIVGLDTWEEYTMPDWTPGYEWTSGGNGYIQSSATSFIRVIYDEFGVEKERYGVVSGDAVFSSPSAIQAYPIEITAGSRIKYSFSFKTETATPGQRVSVFNVVLNSSLTNIPRPANTRYLNGQGQLVPYGVYGGSVPGIPGAAPLWFIYHVTPDGSNTGDWQQVDIISERVPFNSLLIIKLAQVDVPLSETYYKDLRLEIFTGIDELVGQVHTDSQPPVINNRYDEEIQVDDSPANTIAGTLFLETITDPLQDRTQLWQRGTSSELYQLGNLTTFDNLLFRSIQRTKLEGNILTGLLSPLTLIIYTPLSSLNFIFGLLEIDYKKNQSTGTLYELFADGETDDFSQDYKFKYLYRKK